jgi:hypothetical protein
VSVALAMVADLSRWPLRVEQWAMLDSKLHRGFLR